MAEPYDAVVVGSGATGGWAAKELTEHGLRVALLEAGPLLPAMREPTAWSGSDFDRRQPIQSSCSAFDEATSHLFVDDVDNPYSVPDGKPFHWIRSQQVGGRLLVWGRGAMRMSDHEFKAASRDGVGEDWPIAYEDLAPCYGRVERLLGVMGARDGLTQLPDGEFLEPPAMTPGERALKAALERRWTTRRLTSSRIACGSPDATLGAAMRTGRLTLWPNSAATRVLVDDRRGKAHGVALVDRTTGREREVAGRVVVLCASAIESARLLLNSATPEHPNGLANSSGALGRHLMVHTFGVVLEGFAHGPADESGPYVRHGGYIPGYRNVTEDGVDFVRSYGAELQVDPPARRRRQGVRGRFRPQGSWYWVSVEGEVLPDSENRVTVDPSRRDAWGVPIPHIDFSYGENELRMARDQLRCTREMLETSGFEVVKASDSISPPGLSSHEMGTARMGSDPGSSVLNRHNQSWDVSNLFVTDGACFTSSGYQNPTLTMMAITVRACDYIAEKLGRREL